MPLNFNQVLIGGTLTRDPEIKYTPKGTCVCHFSIAINHKWKSDDGTKHEKVTFIEVDGFGKSAETIGDYVKKGHTIMVEGRLDLDSWDDKDTGKKRTKLKVTMERFHFVSKPKESGEDEETERPPRKQAEAPTRRPAASPPRPPVDPDLDAASEDDIPF